jgi:hypothetical protein
MGLVQSSNRNQSSEYEEAKGERQAQAAKLGDRIMDDAGIKIGKSEDCEKYSEGRPEMEIVMEIQPSVDAVSQQARDPSKADRDCITTYENERAQKWVAADFWQTNEREGSIRRDYGYGRHERLRLFTVHGGDYWKNLKASRAAKLKMVYRAVAIRGVVFVNFADRLWLAALRGLERV